MIYCSVLGFQQFTGSKTYYLSNTVMLRGSVLLDKDSSHDLSLVPSLRLTQPSVFQVLVNLPRQSFKRD